MPATLTYPGVYIEEIPSGVRTVSGVSTSVTAFLGTARRGPIGRAVRVLGFADFERRFGGPQAGSELGYAVRQFFQNGGGEAWVVRVAGAATPATLALLDTSSPDRPVLDLTASEAGTAGNSVLVRVDYAAGDDSSFNLTLELPSDGSAPPVVERFRRVSLNSQDPRYVVTLVNDTSTLAVAARRDVSSVLSGVSGTSTSGALVDGTGADISVRNVLDDSHSQLRISANGLPPVTVVVGRSEIATGTPATQLTSLANKIRDKVRTAGASQQAYAQFGAARSGNRLVLTSGVPGEGSSVRVLPGERNDMAGVLMLGPANGGSEVDAAATVRPRPVPDAATLTSGAFANADLDALPSVASNRLAISLDGGRAVTVSVGDTASSGSAGDIGAKLADVAARLQAAVRAARPSDPAFSGFTARADATAKTLILSSGTRGSASAVAVSAAGSNDIAASLHLLEQATAAAAADVTLKGGTETALDDTNTFGAYTGSRADRSGLYALEPVDLFNLLCLPGVSDPGIVAEAAAYVRERRAFLLVDPPAGLTPDQMEVYARGASLPKTDRAAVYYPWVRIPDPLQGGRLRAAPPSGTVAGLYARTDASRGVWKAPAGTEATLSGVQGVDYLLTDAENGVLNPRAVNALRVFPGFGPVAWGARTLRGDDDLADEYRYVPVRRLALYIEESLYRATKWVVFEPNDEALWSQIRLNVGAFMQNLFRQGAFQGRTPAEAYLVRCDRETTTQYDIDRGVVNILVGFAPLKPAEFVIIQLQQRAGQTQA